MGEMSNAQVATKLNKVHPILREFIQYIWLIYVLHILFIWAHFRQSRQNYRTKNYILQYDAMSDPVAYLPVLHLHILNSNTT